MYKKVDCKECCIQPKWCGIYGDYQVFCEKCLKETSPRVGPGEATRQWNCMNK